MSVGTLFHTEHPPKLGTTVEDLVDRALWRQGVVHPSYEL